MTLAQESRPSPWLTWVVTVALAVGTTLATSSFAAGEKAAEVRFLRETVQSQDERIKVLEAYRGDTREVLAALRTELVSLRADINGLRELLAGKPTTAHR